MASQPRVEYQIGEAKFYIRRYEPFLSLKILGEIQKKFLIPIATFMEAQDQDNSADARLSMMTEALEKMSKTLDGPSLIEVTKTVLNPDYVSVSVDGEPADRLDEAMINRSLPDIADLIELVVEVVKVNYTQLFTRGRTLIGKVQSGNGVNL